MHAARPAQVLRGAAVQEVDLPRLEHLEAQAAPEEGVVQPIDRSVVLADPQNPTPSQENDIVADTEVPSAEAPSTDRIAALEADVQRLEGVLQTREAQHAQELEGIRADTEARLRDEITAAVQQWTAMVDRVVGERDRLYAKAEADVVTLATAMAQRILQQAVEVQPQVVLEVVQQALELVRDEEKLMVYVHPDDCALVQEHAADWHQSLAARKVDIVEDAQIDRGGCRIVTENDEVDARLQQQLQAVHDALVVRPS